jgi:hypothetical protein
MSGRQWARGLVVAAATAMLLQACQQPPPASTTRVYAADMAGAAKTCVVPKAAPAAGQETPVQIKLGNDGGWCGITVRDGSRPYSAGLLTSPPAHGKVLIHTVGDDTRIDYTPDRGFAGPDAFSVKLIPGDATLRVSASVGP